MTSHGFPNLFFTGFTQGGVSANIAAIYEQQGEHIAYIIAEALKRGVSDRGAHPGGAGRMVSDHPGRPRSTTPRSTRECTPGYYNNEGGGGGAKRHPVAPRRAVLARASTPSVTC